MIIKNISAVPLLLAAALFMSGCSKAEISETVQSEADSDNAYSLENENPAIVSNPFEEDEENFALMPETDLPPAYISYHMQWNKSDKDYLEYADNGLTVPLTVQTGAAEMQLGLLVFAEGIQQSYTSDISDEKSFMQVFSLSGNHDSDIELHLSEITAAESSENMHINVIGKVNPGFAPTAEKLSDGISHAGDMSVLIPVKVLSPPKTEAVSISSEYDSHPITEDEAHRFGFILDSGGSSMNCVIAPKGETVRPQGVIAAPEDKAAELRLYEYV